MRTRVDELLQELEQEAQATRRVLARVPDSQRFFNVAFAVA